MIRFRSTFFQFPIDVDPGDIVSLTIENQKLYKGFSDALVAQEENSFSIFEDTKEKPLKKHLITVRDLLDLNPNSKKILTAIYKKIDRTALTVERREKFDKINLAIAELLEEIALDFEGTITFNDQIDLTQLLGQYDFKFDYDESSFLNSLISYLRAGREAMDLKLVFTYDLFAYLEDNEIEDLKRELSYIGLSIIDIDHHDIHHEGVKRFVIDKDLCEIY